MDPEPGQRVLERRVTEGEDPTVGADEEVALVVAGRHDPHDVVDMDAEPGQRVLERCVTEGEDPTVGTDEEVALVVAGRHDPHDVVDVDPEPGQRAVEAGAGLSEHEHPTVGSDQVVLLRALLDGQGEGLCCIRRIAVGGTDSDRIGAGSPLGRRAGDGGHAVAVVSEGNPARQDAGLAQGWCR